MKRLQTIDDVCGLPKGSFKAFIKKQEDELKETEHLRRERIHKSRSSSTG